MRLSNLFFAFTLSVISFARHISDTPDSDTEDPFVGTDSFHDPAVWSAPAKPAKVKLCHPTRNDFRRLYRTVVTDDNPDEIDDVLEKGCQLSYLDDRVGELVDAAISHSKNKVLEFLLTRLAFDSPKEQQDALGYHLSMALHHSNFEAADMLLGLIKVVPNSTSLWAPPVGTAKPWNLYRLMHFIFRNQQRITELVPRYENLKELRNPADAILLVELAAFCEQLGSQIGKSRLFVPDYFVYQLLHPETRMDDAGRAEVLRHLIKTGVSVEEYVGYCAANPRGLEKTCAVIRRESSGTQYKEHIVEDGN